MEINQIIAIAVLATVALGVIIGLIIALVKFVVRYKSAKTAAEKEAAINDLKSEVNDIVQNVEHTFDQYKALTGSAAETIVKPFANAKKISAMTQLKMKADEKGYDFDPQYWGSYIENIVSVMNTHTSSGTTDSASKSVQEAPEANSVTNGETTTKV